MSVYNSVQFLALYFSFLFYKLFSNIMIKSHTHDNLPPHKQLSSLCSETRARFPWQPEWPEGLSTLCNFGLHFILATNLVKKEKWWGVKYSNETELLLS